MMKKNLLYSNNNKAKKIKLSKNKKKIEAQRQKERQIEIQAEIIKTERINIKEGQGQLLRTVKIQMIRDLKKNTEKKDSNLDLDQNPKKES